MDMFNIKNFHKLAHEEKNNFLRFIYEIGGDRLKKLFKFPGENFSLWWFSIVAEKSPLKSDAYDRLIAYLDSGQIKSRGFKARIKNNFLYRVYLFLIGFLTIFRLISRSFFVKLSLRNFRARSKILPQSKFIIVTPFPLFDKAKAAKGIYENRFIPVFHRLLEDKHKDDYAHICLHIDSEGLNLKDSLKLINNFNKKQLLFLIEEFFNLMYTTLFFIYYLYFSALFIINLAWIKKNMIYEYNGRKFNVWPIFAHDFYYSLSGPNLAYTIWYIFAFRRLCSYLKKGTKILSICEMEWWEKALYVFAKKRGLVTIGYQHTRLPHLLLNYFNYPEEINTGDFIKCSPLPDYLATAGKIPAHIFRENGWPQSRVFIWGAQRFTEFKDKRNLFVPWKNKENYFLCALSIGEFESRKTIRFLTGAFKQKQDYRIVLKFHPNVDLGNLIKKQKIHLDPEIFEIADTDIGVLAKKAKGMIVTDSSSCLYAMAGGTPVIILRFADSIDTNLLSYISDIPFYVYSPQELKDTCDKIASISQDLVSYEVNSRLLDDYLYFPDRNEEYLEKISDIMARG